MFFFGFTFKFTDVKVEKNKREKAAIHALLLYSSFNRNFCLAKFQIIDIFFLFDFLS